MNRTIVGIIGLIIVIGLIFATPAGIIALPIYVIGYIFGALWGAIGQEEHSNKR